MRIELRAGCRDEPEAAEALRSRLAFTLARFEPRVVRVEIRRQGPSGRRSWRCVVKLDEGSIFEVQEPVPSQEAGAVEHFSDRVARAVALRVAREYLR